MNPERQRHGPFEEPAPLRPSRVPNHRAVGGIDTLSPSTNFAGNLITANWCVVGSSYNAYLIVETPKRPAAAIRDREVAEVYRQCPASAVQRPVRGTAQSR